MVEPLSQADLLRDEIDILYTISSKLTHAATPSEWLEAVSVYARERGASSGMLSWINSSRSDDPYFEVIAQWVRDSHSTGGPVARFQLSDFSMWLDQWVANTNQPVLIRDVMDNSGQDILPFAVHTRACVVLPLNILTRWVGVLAFTWDLPRLFDERDRRIYTAIFQQAPPVIDSMRQFEHNKERMQRAEQLLKVSSALSQATDEQEMLDAVVPFLDQMQPLASASLYHAETDSNDRLISLSKVATRKHGPARDLGQFLDAKFWGSRSGEILYIDGNTPGLLLPLVSRARWQGLLAIQWLEPHQLSGSEQYACRSIQQALAAVVASRRAYLAEQEIRKEHEVLFKTSAAINAANNFAEIVASVSKLNFDDGDMFLSLFENYSYDGANYVEIVAQSGESDSAEPRRFPIDRTPLLRILPRSGVFACENIATNPDIDDVSRKFLLANGIESGLGISLCLDEKWAGILNVSHRSPRIYTAQEKRLLQGIGTLVEAAVERIRLRHETETAREHAEHLAEEAQKVAALEERNRLARELHDSVSQALYGIALGARTARKLLDRGDTAHLSEPLDYVLSLAEAGLTEMRALIFDLRPDALVSEGLVTALDKQAKSIRARHGIEVNVRLGSEPQASNKIKEELYRIAREALHNAVKHARAQSISIEMTCNEEVIAIEIVDNGAGFDLHDSFPGHFGLKSMWERAYKLGGYFDIWSEPGKGTKVIARLPVEGRKK